MVQRRTREEGRKNLRLKAEENHREENGISNRQNYPTFIPPLTSYRKQNRERPIIGDRRPPSPLGNIQPDHWLAEYTTELINVLNVLGWLVELEPAQASLLERICTGPLLSLEELRAADAFALPAPVARPDKKEATPDLFGEGGT